MKLLLVDDEALTREGLLTNIDWQSLGIKEVLTADDGVNGLALAKKSKPHIIVSDVRMPRMNGIDMVIAIRSFLPDTSVVFMSGYSDKEYLKAAIKLKAVNYVEKPLDTDEVTAAISDAVASALEKQQTLQSISIQKLVASNNLILDLVNTPHDTTFPAQFSNLGIPLKSTTHFLSLIVKLHPSVILSEYKETLTQLCQELIAFSLNAHFHILYTMKQEDYIIFCLIYQDSLSHHTIEQFCQLILDRISPDYNLFITVGKSVSDYSLFHSSYNSAVILLQVAFFHEFNQVLYDGNISYPSYQVTSSFFTAYESALQNKSLSTVTSLLESLFVSFQKNPYTLVHYVKEIYYKLFDIMTSVANTIHINIREDAVDSESVLHAILGCPTLSSLHQMISEKTVKFFDCLAQQQSEDSTIHMIKDYISKNYQNDILSTKDIGDYVYLSPSYVCTIFKNETGQTLNQFLTEYRVNKAKHLLMDPRYKINDISSKVGYADSNYFGKTFKKITGISPSEFRENYLL